MTVKAVVLTYHAIEPGPPPLCVAPDVFERHLDAVAEAGARAVTVSQLARLVREGASDEQVVAITFDDGMASVVAHAAQLLAERGLPATVFCVAGRLGGTSDWGSRRPDAPVFELADAAGVAALARAGFEIGSHGLSHDPLTDATLARELSESKRILEQASGAAVESFAFPYGVCPRGAGKALAQAAYSAACTARVGLVDARSDPFALPRVDAHYVRRPQILRELLAGRRQGYIRARGIGGRVRRLVRKDYAGVGRG